MNKKYVVFIPCYNAASTIELTLESVQKAVSETGAYIPVFIYDDCSKDASPAIVEEFSKRNANFHLVRNSSNSGERKTTNNAFASFRHQFNWAFIIHADDIVKANWLTMLIDQIEQADDASCFTVWSSFDTFYEKDNTTRPGEGSGEVHKRKRDMEAIRGYIIKVSSSWHISGAALNVELYCRLNGFHEDMAQFGDTDFFVRGFLAGYSDVYIASSLTIYRIVPGSVSAVSFRTNRDIREIYMLIEKYRHLLDNKGVEAMYRTISSISGRRVVKWLLRREFALALKNLKQFGRSTAERISFRLRPSNVGK